jgi:hypothetical protein
MAELSLTQNGQDVGAMLPQDISVSGKSALQIADQYVDMEEAQVRELVREFKKSTSEWTAMEENDAKDNTSELDGKKVRFKWNADESRYDISFAEGEGDQKHLEKLDWDADYTALLPNKSVSEGDRWEVDPKGLGKVLMPGQALESFAEGEEDNELAEMMKSAVIEQFDKLVAALQTKCEYAGQREVDGVNCGVIKLEVSVDETLDLADMFRKLIEAQVGEMEIKTTIDEASLAVKASGKGELLWDLGAGHAHAFDLGSEMKFEIALTMSVDAQGQTVDIDGSAEFAGDVAWKMELE